MEAIKYYVKGAFQGVKATPEVLEQQEELIADLTAKVADLVAQGRSEEEYFPRASLWHPSSALAWTCTSSQSVPALVR